MATPRSKVEHESATAINALDLLTQDHFAAKLLFIDYQELMDDGSRPASRAEIADRICAALTVHTLVEEEIFYPAVRELLADSEIMDKVELEHSRLREMIMALQGMQPGEPDYDATLIALGVNFNIHVENEENIVFPKARQAGLETALLGEQIRQRQHEIDPQYQFDDTVYRQRRRARLP